MKMTRFTTVLLLPGTPSRFYPINFLFRVSFNQVRYWVFRYSPFWILAFMFGVGTASVNLMSLFYLVASLTYVGKLEVLTINRSTN